MYDNNNAQLLEGKTTAEQAKNEKPQFNMPNMGGMGGQGGQMGNFLTNMMMQNPEVMSDPEVMQLLQNPAFQQKLAMYQQSGNIMAMFQDPDVQKIMGKLQGNKQGGNDVNPEEVNVNKDFTKPTENVKTETKTETKPTTEVNPTIKTQKDEATKLFKAKKFEEAIVSYQKCLELDPNDYIYHSNILACMIELKQ